MTDMETRLETLLRDFRYESSVGLGQRGLLEHHITALKGVLVPFINDLMTDLVFRRDERDYNSHGDS